MAHINISLYGCDYVIAKFRFADVIITMIFSIGRYNDQVYIKWLLRLTGDCITFSKKLHFAETAD